LNEILDEANEIDINPFWAQLQANGEVEDGATLDDFLRADQVLTTTGTRTLEEIAESVQEHAIESEGEEESVEVQPKPPVSRQDAYKGFDLFRRYAEQNVEDPKIMQACHVFEDFLHQERIKSLTQAPITQFMPVKNSNQSCITQFFA